MTRVVDDLDEVAEFLQERLRDGGHILVPQAASEPVPLLQALSRVKGLRQLVTVYVGHAVTSTVADLSDTDFRIVALAAAGDTRKLVAAGRAEVMPMQWSHLVAEVLSGRLVLDVAVLQVAPAKAGFHSFGIGADLGPLLAGAASTIVVEVNEQMPRTLGHGGLEAARVDLALHTGRELPTVPVSEPSDVESAIGQHVAGIVRDGAVVQVGIGAVPEAVLFALGGHRDLGVHTGLFGDGLMRLVEQGVVTNARNAANTGASVTGAILGTRELYSWVHENPRVVATGLADTHGPSVLPRLSSFTAINSAIEVDLSGQVNAEDAGGRYIGAVGGQVDFVRAAARAPEGLSIIALSARTPRGVGKIVPRLSQGTVSTLRTDVEVVVTEYGVADLRLVPLRERARRLIEISHPEDRAALAEAHGRG
jgi:acyl-CoA hydrolase